MKEGKKKNYHPPTIADYGKIEDLTKAKAPHLFADVPIQAGDPLSSSGL